jgi:hypothetical protein
VFDTYSRYFQLDRRNLVYLKFILEAYEGLATLSTVNREGAVVRIGYPHFSSRDVDALLLALGKEIEMTEVPQPADCHGLPPAVPRDKEANHAG